MARRKLDWVFMSANSDLVISISDLTDPYILIEIAGSKSGDDCDVLFHRLQNEMSAVNSVSRLNILDTFSIEWGRVCPPHSLTY